MGVRRYSRDPQVQRRQELFDHLQWRTGIDYYAPTLGELAAAGIKRAMPACRDYACLHQPNEPIALSAWPAKMATRTLRKKLVCSKCGLRRPRLQLVWEGD
jgi:hypothetical protein